MGLPLASRGIHSELRTLNGNCIAIPFTFTTGVEGADPTFAYDYDGAISIALVEGTPDEFVITIGTYGRFLAAVATSSIGATVNLTPTSSAADGTITLEATADALASCTVSGVIFVQL